MQCRKGLYAMQAVLKGERQWIVWTLGEEHLESEALAYRCKCHEVGRCLLCVKNSTADVAAVESSLMKVCIQRKAKVHLHWPRGCFPGVGDVEILF